MIETTTSSGTPRNTGPAGELKLVVACKPHTQAITTLAVDEKGTLLATGVSIVSLSLSYCCNSTLQSTDCTVFFLSIKNNFSPIGYVTVPAPVVHSEWSTESELLVCCNEGSMVLVTPPVGEEVDTSHSYHLSSLNVVSRKFTSIKDRLRVRESKSC